YITVLLLLFEAVHPLLKNPQLFLEQLDLLLGFLPLLEQGRVAGGAEAVKALVGIGVGAHRGEAGELAADEDLAVTAFLAIFTGGAEATAGAAGHPFFAAGQGFLVYVLAFRA